MSQSISYKGNHLKRLMGTSFSFIVFALGSVIISLFVFPLVSLFSPELTKKKIRIRWIIHKCFGLFIRFMVRLGLIDFQVLGEEKTAKDKGCLVLANHPSLIDVVALISIYPNANCIVKKQLWKNPIFAGVVRWAQYIRNDEGEKILKKCDQALKSGEVLIIFPEGTRTQLGAPSKYHRGASQIALRLECAIRLVHIMINPSTLTKEEPWYKISPRKSQFKIKIGDMINTDKEKNFSIPIAARRLTKRVQKELESVEL